MSERPTPETDAEAEKLDFKVNLNFARKLERERDEAREALSEWENEAAHVEADHPDEVLWGCIPVLRKLLKDARKERDEARELCRELADLVAYGLGQSGEPWSLDAMRQAHYAIHKAKQMGTLPTD